MATQPDSKTTPKTESAGAAPQNPFAAFDPMAAWTVSQQTFQKMMADAHTRAQTFAEQYAALEAQMFARAQTAIDTWAQLARDTLAYSEQLAAQARKMGLDAARKAGVGA